jgi:hypothetical protein
MGHSTSVVLFRQKAHRIIIHPIDITGKKVRSSAFDHPSRSDILIDPSTPGYYRTHLPQFGQSKLVPMQSHRHFPVTPSGGRPFSKLLRESGKMSSEILPRLM